MKLELTMDGEKVTALTLTADHEEDKQQIRRISNVLWDDKASDVTHGGQFLPIDNSVFKEKADNSPEQENSKSDDANSSQTNGASSEPRTAEQVKADHGG